MARVQRRRGISGGQYVRGFGKKAVRWAPGVLSLVIAISLVWYAIASLGFPRRQLELNDTGLWISNDAGGEFGRINKAASGLDGRVSPPGARLPKYELDVIQDGNAALMWDQTNGSLTKVDTASIKPQVDQSVGVDPSGDAKINGGTLATIDQTGRIWASRYDPFVGDVSVAELGGEATPLAELGLPVGAPVDAKSLAVGTDGTIYAAGVNGKLVIIRPEGEGFGAPQISQPWGALGKIDVTAVGASVVGLDVATKRLFLPGGRIVSLEVDPSARLQQPSAGSESVLVASSKELLRVDLGSGRVTVVDAGGDGPPAAPVHLGGCDFGTWSGIGRVIRACDSTGVEVQQVDRTGGLIRPAFRVNHGLILLNDQANGRAYDLDTKTSVDNWPDVHPQGNRQNQQKEKVNTSEAKPRAVDDVLKARADRTTVLHVLDNDTDSAGSVLSIQSVNTSGVPSGVRLEISPDGQTIKLVWGKNAKRVDFSYVISNGRVTDEGRVTVTEAGSQNTVPHLREGAAPMTYSAASFGKVSIPVLADWRDDEGDPVTLLSATDPAGDAIPVTTDGVLDFTAGEVTSDKVQTVNYRVTDGAQNRSVKGAVSVKVLASKAVTAVPAKAQPDIARGKVGQPITIWPLANDIAGADPRNLNATMRLNASVAQKANITVTTDLKTGQVQVVAARQGPYYLDYSVAFGAANLARGTIRIDALSSAADGPVAMPDQASVRGRSAAMVDVLANDYDPSGGLLTVQSATAAEPNQLQAQVIGGRWIRIVPSQSPLSPNPQAVHYTITNGSQTASGDVLVTQLPELDQDAVLARTDAATVRVGDSVLISALDNDRSLSGQPLSLVTDGLGPKTGQLSVIDRAKAADEDQGEVGTAYVRGNQVRYVAPASADGTRQVVISYAAQTPSGETAQSQIVVTIKPAPSEAEPNRAPEAGSVEVRVVSGSRIKIPVPTSGQDPDGDTVTVAGIDSAPTLGRIVGYSPNSLTYEAYPTAGQVGTDTFSYRVTDRYGKTGVGTIRVAVSEPGQTQLPVAVDDQVTAAPGADVKLNVLSNDYVARDDSVRLAALDRFNQPMPSGLRVGGEVGPIQVKAGSLAGQPILVNYALSGNGGTGPMATIKVVTKAGYNNAPTVSDQNAELDGKTAKASLLTGAWDLEDGIAGLRVEVLARVPGLTLSGDQVQVPTVNHPQVIPFQVTDSAGAVSAGVIYVPAEGDGPPRLKADGLIQIATNATSSFSVGDYVESPRGRSVRISSATIVTSPGDYLSAKVDDAGRFTLTSQSDYVGPAAVTVEVMDSGSLTDPGVLTSTVTIPVQVGARTPVLRCPSEAQTVIQGGEIKDLDITSLCHVWSPDPQTLPQLAYTADWDQPIAGVTATGGGHVVKLQAAGTAPDRGTGRLRIGIVGTAAKPATIQIQIVPAPPAVFRSVKLTDIKAGAPVTVPISVLSPLLDANTKVLAVKQIGGGKSSVTMDQAAIVVTPDVATFGPVTFQVRATDLGADPARQSRWVTGTVSLSVYTRPDPPSPPINGPTVQSRSATISWRPGNPHGASIDSYEVKIASGPGSGRVTTCRSTPCQIKGLTNGEAVTFQVRAHNKADWSEWSGSSARITPDVAPGAPSWVKVGDPQDHSVTVSWGPIANDGSPIKVIHITTSGGGVVNVPAGRNSATVKVPSNNEPYTFSVSAENNYKVGPSTSEAGQSSGKPIGLNVESPQPTTSVGASTSVRISWTLASAEGPRPVRYAVSRSDGKAICSGTTAQSCVDDSVTFTGTTYRYSVTATNDTGGAAHSTASSSPTWAAVGTPDAWSGDWSAEATGSDGEARLKFTVPASRGATSKVTVTRGGSTVATVKSPGPAGGAVNTKIDGLPDGAKSELVLHVCNEAKKCMESRPRTVTTFGDLKAPAVSASHDGDEVTGTATGNGNGETATLTLFINGAEVGSKVGTGSLTVTRSRTVGYDKTVDVKATLETGNTTPQRRDGGSSSTRETTGPPPPHKVTISKGEVYPPGLCGAEFDGDRYCYNLEMVTKNYIGKYTCVLNGGEVPTWGGTRRKEFDAGQTTYAWFVSPNTEPMSVTCGDTTSNVVD